MNRRFGGTLALAAAVACSELRAAELEDAGVTDDGGVRIVEKDSGSGDAKDAYPTADGGRRPCPAPCKPEHLSTVENLGPLVVDSFNVYFASANGGVFRCAKTGCQGAPTSLGSGKTTRLALASGRLFWGEDDHLVACATVGCGGIPQGLATSQTGIDEVMSDGTSVAWHARAGSEDFIRTCPAKTCSQEQVAEITAVVSPRSGMGIADGKVFWSDVNTELRFCPLDPLPCFAPAKLGPGSSDFVFFDGLAYWVHEQNVVSCPLAGCDGLPKKIGTSSTPHLLAIDETDVYWREMADDKVLRCPSAGCNDTPEEIAVGVNGIFYGGLALDNDYVYWTSKTGLWRRQK